MSTRFKPGMIGPCPHCEEAIIWDLGEEGHVQRSDCPVCRCALVLLETGHCFPMEEFNRYFYFDETDRSIRPRIIQ